MSNPELFKQQKYLDLKGLVPKDLCKIATKYALLKEEFEFSPETGVTAQVQNAHSVYSDTLMETMMHFLHPHLEKNTGLELCPTYTYYRVYRPGMILEKHTDRESCEISTTICFGFNYIHSDPDYRWGMYVGDDKLIKQNPGDIIAYRGCEVEHWRLPYDGEEQTQVFLHYVDAEGPHSNQHLDGRPMLGLVKK
jgi:hypothetical protein